MKNTTQHTKIMVTSQKSSGVEYPTLTSLSEEALAKTLASLEKEKDSLVAGVDYSITTSARSKKSNLSILSGKTLEVLCQAIMDGTLPRYKMSFPKQGTLSRGKFSTPSTLESLKIENVSLSSVLEENVPEKYFLSDQALMNILTKQSSKGAQLHLQSEEQGGGIGVEIILSKSTNLNTQTIESTKRGGVAPTLNTMQGGNRQPFILIPEPTRLGYAIVKEGDSINLSVPNSKTRRGRVGHGVAQTLDTGMQQYTLVKGRVRRLTELECERIMGWPDGHTAGVSSSQRYKICGNGVVSNVVHSIIEKLI